MRVQIEPGVRSFIDVAACSHRPDGDQRTKVPTLVLLHGGPGHDRSAFKPDLLPLADDMQVLFVDHRGMGRSDRRMQASGISINGPTMLFECAMPSVSTSRS